MSTIVQALVWQVPFPNPIAKLVAVKLADWADDDGGTIYPAIETIVRHTNCSRSTVCNWLRALEHSGVLEVVERSVGGARGETTERAFNMELLRRLAPTPDPADRRKRGRRTLPPELVLTTAKRDREVVADDGSRKTVPVIILQIAPRQRDSDLMSGASMDEPVPVHEPDGSDDATRPPDGRVPVHDADPTRPAGGPEPSINRHRESNPPLPPRGRGSAKLDLIQVLLDDGQPEHVVQAFFGTLIRDYGLQPWKVEDPVAIARTLCAELADDDSEVLRAAAAAISARQTHRLPPVAVARAVVADARAAKLARLRNVELESRANRRREARGADMQAHADALRDRLRHRLGAAVVADWLDDLECEGVEAGRLTVSLGHHRGVYRARYVREQFLPELSRCAAAQIPGVRDVTIVVRDDEPRMFSDPDAGAP